jgi:hypothetical protein
MVGTQDMAGGGPPAWVARICWGFEGPFCAADGIKMRSGCQETASCSKVTGGGARAVPPQEADEGRQGQRRAGDNAPGPLILDQGIRRSMPSDSSG